MNWRGIRAIIRKDLMVVTRSRNTMLAMIVVPLLFTVALPAGMILLSSSQDMLDEFSPDGDMALFFNNLPASINDELSAFPQPNQQIIILLTMYLFAPMFLILPMMTSSILAADSFAGEKDRKTLEALIYTPLTDAEIFIAKLLSSFVPALLVSLLGGLAYGLVVNTVAAPIMGRIFFPNLTWVALIFWVAPAAAALGLGAVVLVSSRVNSAQEANQLSGLIVVPLVLLVIGQLGGVVYLSAGVVFSIGFVFWLLGAALLWYGARTFKRGELLARL
ncbi:MAG: ABC transporter permease subunit [Anaerolineae bacterium]|nr:ABC transporter permease subunit [Anaerolineae bacterium]